MPSLAEEDSCLKSTACVGIDPAASVPADERSSRTPRVGPGPVDAAKSRIERPETTSLLELGPYIVGRVSLINLPSAAADPAVDAVVAELRRLDPDGSRMAKVFRSTFDQLYDGQHTGRYKVEQLFKTEKTHFGTLIEINLQRELKIPDGLVLDFTVAGFEVDCKYSHTGAWMLPIESFEQIVLVTQANDRTSVWSVGVVRATEENRRTGENRDRKTGLNARGRSQITWVFKDAQMQPNALLQLPSSTVSEIMAGRSGQARVNDLFRRATNRRLSRNIIATVAQQDDYMKRVRYNGGSRSALRPEGYLILGGDYLYQRDLAAALGAVVPEPGEFVSVRVTPAGPEEGVGIDGEWWRLAAPDEYIDLPAPLLPR